MSWELSPLFSSNHKIIVWKMMNLNSISLVDAVAVDLTNHLKKLPERNAYINPKVKAFKIKLIKISNYHLIPVRLLDVVFQ